MAPPTPAAASGISAAFVASDGGRAGAGRRLLPDAEHDLGDLAGALDLRQMTASLEHDELPVRRPRDDRLEAAPRDQPVAITPDDGHRVLDPGEPQRRPQLREDPLERLVQPLDVEPER